MSEERKVHLVREAHEAGLDIENNPIGGEKSPSQLPRVPIGGGSYKITGRPPDESLGHDGVGWHDRTGADDD